MFWKNWGHAYCETVLFVFLTNINSKLLWIATNTCRSLKFLFLEIESMTLIAQWCIFFFFCHFLNWKIIEQYPKWKFISAIEKKVIINLLIWIKMEQIWIKSFFYGIFVLFQQSIRKLLGGKNSPFLSYDFLWRKIYCAF